MPNYAGGHSKSGGGGGSIPPDPLAVASGERGRGERGEGRGEVGEQGQRVRGVVEGWLRGGRGVVDRAGQTQKFLRLHIPDAKPFG